MKSWFQRNVNVGHWLIIATIAIGFISSNAIGNFTGDQTTEKVTKMEPEVIANVQHRSDDNIHMPFAEKVKVFVPRTEFEVVQEDVKELKVGQTKIYDLLLERLPKSD